MASKMPGLAGAGQKEHEGGVKLIPRSSSTSDIASVATNNNTGSVSDVDDMTAQMKSTHIEGTSKGNRFAVLAKADNPEHSTSSKGFGKNSTYDPSGFQQGKYPSGDVFGSTDELEQATPRNLAAKRSEPAITTRKSNFSNKLGGLITQKSVEFALEHTEPMEKNTQALITPSAARTLKSRSSNISGRNHVAGVDAQEMYPSTACIFVANLPEPRDDRALEAAVTREFSQYGTVFVKLRRDNNNMPFAFCQFIKDEDARAAKEQGRGALIFGRPCRTEMVRASRTFVVSKLGQSEITPDEVEALLEPFGPLSSCEYLGSQLQKKLDRPGAVIAEFAKFDPARDVPAAFRDDVEYRVEAFDTKRNTLSIRGDPDEAYLRQYETDRRSIFIGNLPTTVNEDDLQEIFGEAGEILTVQIISKPQIPAFRPFGFVEFVGAEIPDIAIRLFNNTDLYGAKIRVERKVAKEQGTRSNYQTPRRQTPHGLGPRHQRSQGFNDFQNSPGNMVIRRHTSSIGAHVAQAAAALDTPTKDADTPRGPVAQHSASKKVPTHAQQQEAMMPPPIAQETMMPPPVAPPYWNFNHQAYVNPGMNQAGPYQYPAQYHHQQMAGAPFAYYGQYWPQPQQMQPMAYMPDPAAAWAYYHPYGNVGASSQEEGDGDGVTTPTRKSPAKEE